MNKIILIFCALFTGVLLAATPSEIVVKLNLSQQEYVAGESIRGIVDIANSSSETIDVGHKGSEDRVFVELFRRSDMKQFDKLSKHAFVAPFAIGNNEGKRLEVRIGDHFMLTEETRYLARVVLVHRGMRFESAMKMFLVVPGLACGRALQLFKNKPGLKRDFELVHWGRDQMEHLFLKVCDKDEKGTELRRWTTADLGVIIRVTPPKVSILPSGEVVTLHRATQDAFIRSVFWSLPDAFEFQEHEQMLDPDVAGAERVKALYRDSGGVAPVKKAWWKFW